MNYEISSRKIKNYEATFKVYLKEGDENLYEIYASFGAYASEDEAYAEDIEFSVYLGDQEVHPDRAEYKDLFEKLDEEIQEYVLDNAYEIWQDRMEGAADAAYDAWKESQYE